MIHSRVLPVPATLRLTLCRSPPLHSPPVIDAKPLGPTSGEVVITPPTENGPWAKYVCKVCVKGTTTCTTLPACTANPAPATTTCPIPNLTPATTYTVECDAEKDNGDKNPVSTPDELTTPAEGAPSLIADPVSPVEGVAHVTPPNIGGPWATYDIKVCKVVGGVVDDASCRQLSCPANADPAAVTDCPIPGCEAETVYRVWATAVKADGTTKSPQSNPDDFTTPQHSAPVIQVDDAKTTKTTAVAVVTPPVTAPTGGWDTFELEICPVKPAGACFKQTCHNKPNPSPATTDCLLESLTEGTEYTVQATAVKGPIRSLPSNKDDFVTKPAGQE